MIVGALGELVFKVSYDEIRTPSNVQWSGSARYAQHNRHNWHALAEFTGLDGDKMTMKIKLSRSLGSPVMLEMVKLWKYQREGTPVSLVLGDKAYGKYRWVITNHTMDMQYFDHAGNLIECDVSLELLEYLNV